MRVVAVAEAALGAVAAGEHGARVGRKHAEAVAGAHPGYAEPRERVHALRLVLRLAPGRQACAQVRTGR